MGLETTAEFEPLLDALLAYCSSKKVFISSALKAQYSPESGLGIRAVEKIKPGQRLIDAPVSCLLTTATIPKSFLPDAEVRKQLTVHGLLATWLAFGNDVELGKRYEGWIDTWPSWPSFRDSMPIFWNWKWDESLSDIAPRNGEHDRLDNSELCRKRRRLASSAAKHENTRYGDGSLESSPLRLLLSPAFYNQWLSTSGAAQQPSNKESMLNVMTEKVKNILTVLSKHHELLGFDVLSAKSRRHYTRFLHMWCCVNTRCFYYVAPGMQPPEDSNEAMALVPFLDLFNHATVSDGAAVKYDRKGFHVKADQKYEIGDEVFVQYGKHSNDALWSEYGFVLANNVHDELDIGSLVLSHISAAHQALLKKKKYLGNYVVRMGEVCYRTEAAAWLVSGALKQGDWASMIEGRYDPEQLPAKNYSALKLKMKQRIVDWMMILRHECALNAYALLTADTDSASLRATFVPSLDLFDAEEIDSPIAVDRIARSRYNACASRWGQIYEICMSAVRALESDSPGAYLTGTQDRGRDLLDMDWPTFLIKCRKGTT